MSEFTSNLLKLPKNFDTLMPIAQNVHPDEKAWALREVNAGTDGLGWHRVQAIYVDRGDRVARWSWVVGPAADYTAPPLEIISLWEHTVGELRDMAEQQRLGDNYWQNFLAEKQAESTLITDFLDQKEEMLRVARNTSTYGPNGHKQRDGFDRGAAKEKVHGR